MEELLKAIAQLLESVCAWLPDIVTGNAYQCAASVVRARPILLTLVIIGIVGHLAYRLLKEREADASKAYDQLDQNYLGLYRSAMFRPHVLDPTFTYNHENCTGTRRLVYEAYAFQVWIVCETIYDLLCLGRRSSLINAVRTVLVMMMSPRLRKTVLSQVKTGEWQGVTKVFQREVQRRMSRLSERDWLTWKTALDIEARLHIKWFLAEDRFARSFKKDFRDNILINYGRYVRNLKADAFSRYDASLIYSHLEQLQHSGVARTFDPGVRHAISDGMKELLASAGHAESTWPSATRRD